MEADQPAIQAAITIAYIVEEEPLRALTQDTRAQGCVSNMQSHLLDVVGHLSEGSILPPEILSLILIMTAVGVHT